MDIENKSRRQLQSEQTKDRLFHAAMELLAERNFDDITIRDIVARAEVSIGTFYNYYSTKMEVFYEAYRIADHYFAETVAPLLSQGTVLERIMSFFDYYAHYSSDLTDLRMTKLLYNPDNTLFCRDPHQGMVGVLLQIIHKGLDEGALVSGDSAEEIAEYLMVAVRGLVYPLCTPDAPYDLAASTRRFVHRLLAYYLPASAKPV